MGTRRWLLAGIPALMLGCGSTSGTTIDDKKLAHVPNEDKQSIFTAQHNVDIAEQNVASGKAAKEEADQFNKVASTELDAAKSKLEAARASIDLGKQAHSPDTLSSAQRGEDMARKELTAAQAKKDYADRLIALRQSKVDEGEAALNVAKAEVEMSKLQALKKNDMEGGIDDKKLFESRRKAQDELAEKRLRVSQLEGEVATLRTAWEERRRTFNTASRDVGAPPAPTMMPMPGTGTTTPPPAPGVNEGPSAPQSIPETAPQR